METSPPQEEPTPGGSSAAADEPSSDPAPKKPNRFWIDFGPLLAFFGANLIWGIYFATAVLVVAVLAATLWSWVHERRISPMSLFTAVAVLLFGSLTLWLQDETFLKVKVTIINVLLGGGLLVGLATGRPLLKMLLGQAVQLTDEGWRQLTLRYAAFFLATAVVNEAVWRNVTTDTWVTFKVFGVLGLTLVFSALQIPLFTRHMIENEEEASA